MKEHIAWLEKNFKDGYFIAAGRKNPRTGGMILVKEMPQDQLNGILNNDPFQSVANYEITTVDFARTGAGFEKMVGL